MHLRRGRTGTTTWCGLLAHMVVTTFYVSLSDCPECLEMVHEDERDSPCHDLTDQHEMPTQRHPSVLGRQWSTPPP